MKTKSPTGIRGVLETFEEADGIGTLRLEDGRKLHFGHDSLRGIDVDHQGPVVVYEVREHPHLGLCAFDVRDATFDDLPNDEQRASIIRRLGLSQEPGNHPGWCAVGFPGTPPLTVKDWEWIGNRLAPYKTKTDLAETINGLEGTIRVGSCTLVAGVMLQPMAIAENLADPRFHQAHQSCVWIIPSVLFTAEYRLQNPQSIPDPWQQGEWARAATALILALLDFGGVMVHLPFAMVCKPANIFRQQSGDPQDRESRGWEAWIHGGRTESGDFLTFGMEANTLPNVTVYPDPALPWSRQVEAGLYACQKMVFENRSLSNGERLAIPLGHRHGPHAPGSVEAPHGVVPWCAQERESIIVLQFAPD